jgi:hypothetical protein
MMKQNNNANVNALIKISLSVLSYLMCVLIVYYMGSLAVYVAKDAFRFSHYPSGSVSIHVDNVVIFFVIVILSLVFSEIGQIQIRWPARVIAGVSVIFFLTGFISLI